jgi:hypothetical protein
VTGRRSIASRRHATLALALPGTHGVSLLGI